MKYKIHTSFLIIFDCSGDDGVDGNNGCDGKSADEGKSSGDCNEDNWDRDLGDCEKGDWDIDRDGDCDSENSVEDNDHRGSDGVEHNFMDPDGEDATAVDWNVHCNAYCDSNWKGVWDVDSQKDSEYNWHGECDANCEGIRGDDWEGDWEGNWAIDCNNDLNCDWDSKWNGGWDTDEENNCGTNCDGDCDIDNDADGDGERNGNNDNHSVGDGVGCGRIDSDGKDLSAAVGVDTGGVADTGAINAKDKKKTLLTKCSHQHFFSILFSILHLNFNLHSLE